MDFGIFPRVILPLLFALLAMPQQVPADSARLDESKLAQITEQTENSVKEGEVAGGVALVATKDDIAHLSAAGLADVSSKTPMQTDTIFWIASMTKPIAATAIMMLQDKGKLSVDDPASKYLPELKEMKMPDGTLAKPVTLRHLMTHTAGLPENTNEETNAAANLQDLVTAFSKRPMQFEPGAQWRYSQTAINSLGRIVEIVSGKEFAAFLDERLFQPLGMKDTTFYPTKDQLPRIATSYRVENEAFHPAEIFIFAGRDVAERNRVPLANGGLFSTAPDYARFAQMFLNNGSLDGKQYLKPQTVQQMITLQTNDLKTGFTDGNGWGLGWAVIREPQGVTAMLSPGAYGHGGAYGTQCWIDPEKGLALILMVQRANFPNADNSEVRKSFQQAAVEALKK